MIVGVIVGRSAFRDKKVFILTDNKISFIHARSYHSHLHLHISRSRNSYVTWKKFGDAASGAFQFVLACDLYSEGLKRDPPKPPRPAPYAFVARAYVRAGKTKEAEKLAEKAAYVASKNKFLKKDEVSG